MEQKSICMLFVSAVVLILAAIITQGCCKERYCIKIITDENNDTTYSIVDRMLNETVYYSGHNTLSKEKVIEGSYVFIEDIITEECSDRIIVCSPKQETVFVAYNLGWCFRFNDIDWRQLLSGVDKEYSIEKLDLNNKKIQIRFFNNDVSTLDLCEVNKY